MSLERFENYDEDLSIASETKEESNDVVIITERDEVLEVKKRAHKENQKVNMWRNVVTGALICTAVAVVSTTYIILVKEEIAMFETAVSTDERTFQWELTCFCSSSNSVEL